MPIPNVADETVFKDKDDRVDEALQDLYLEEIRRNDEDGGKSYRTRMPRDSALIEQIEDVQARMDADELLAASLQEQEREQFYVDE
ncbi:hypothetical protein Tco_1056483 [Tanacetum coccineum]|uniref:Uncharacterized protein n=1 Tax=Tanacetum coccineum TaxID=301880 RepID=A0ABQ5H2T1_9ASTR